LRIYSTFLQRVTSGRADVAVQNLPVRFALDRAAMSAPMARRIKVVDLAYLVFCPTSRSGAGRWLS